MVHSLLCAFISIHVVEGNRKRLKRIFPSDDKTVLIIDDRADVWDFSRNLIQVAPFYFFIGTGDVNEQPGMAKHVLPDVRIPTEVETGTSVRRFVREPDMTLQTVLRVLSEAYSVFFQEYSDAHFPDIKEILDEIKGKIFEGLHFVFSGMVPLHQSTEDNHLARIATQFGATCERDLTPFSTHVITYRHDTSKVLLAVQKGLKIVTPDWILQSIFSWEKLPEENFKPAKLPDASGLTDAPVPLSIDVDFKELAQEFEEFRSSSDEGESEDEDSDIEARYSPKRRRTSSVFDIEQEDGGEGFSPDLSSDFADELERELL